MIAGLFFRFIFVIYFGRVKFVSEDNEFIIKDISWTKEGESGVGLLYIYGTGRESEM